MTNNINKNLCISNIFNGLVEGLSKFSSQSKVALIYASTPDSDIFVYDPQNILKEHESILKEEYYQNRKKLKKDIKKNLGNQPKDYLAPTNKLNLAGNFPKPVPITKYFNGVKL